MVRILVRPLTAYVTLSLTAAVAGCVKSEKSENPLSPNIAGPMPGVEISTPILLEPGRGRKFRSNEQPVELLVENASTNGPRPLLYRFEVAADGGFRTVVFAREGVPQGEGGQTGRTAIRLADRLEDGRTYFWRARAYDGANTGEFAVGLNFEIQKPPRLFLPQLLEPINGQTAPTQRPHLKVRNAPREGPTGNVNYLFQVAGDSGFGQILSQGSVPENLVTGETIWLPGADLAFQGTFYWRVMATDGQVSSPWQATSFRTPNPPTPVPGPVPSVSCGTPATHFDVVACQRSAFGTPMSAGEKAAMMKAVARQLNVRGFAGGPFGALVKTSGTNCNGYSCDIICAGNGPGQRQWDVLIDGEGAAAPTWSPVATPTVRPCEIQ